MNRNLSNIRQGAACFAGLLLALATLPSPSARGRAANPAPPITGAAPAPTTVIPSPIPAGTGAGAAPSGPPAFRAAPTRLRAPTNAPASATTPVVATPNAPGGAATPGAGNTAGATKEAKDGEPNMTAEEARNLKDDDLVTLNLPNAPLETALDLYAGLVRRVLLRPPQLAGGPINLKFEDLTREEAIEAMNAVFALNAISVVPVGEKFVKVVPSQQVVQEAAVASNLPIDQMSELGQYVVKLVKVTKVKPGDIAQAVQQFASGKVQNGVLVFDDQNFFILRDMAPNVKRMVELITELDVTIELDYKLVVIPIRYGKVDEIYETLNSVVTGSGGGGLGSRSGNRQAGFTSGAGTTGTGIPGQPGTTGSPFNSRSSSSSSRYGSRSTGMTSPGAARSNLGDRLRQVSSAAVGGAGGGGAQYNLLGDSRIIPDMRSNSLLVYANKEDLAMLTNIVAKIDTLLAQVLIESIILEVTLEKGKDVGVSMVQHPQQFGSWSSAAGSINKAGIATNLIGAVLPGGFSYFGQLNDDFSVAITALANDSRAKVLARPRIQTTHAQQASFRIGDTVPYPRSSSPYYGGVGGSTGYAPYTTYDEKDVVTELTVTPYITPDGLVTLEVDQKIDQLGPTTKVGQDDVPTIRTRSATAVLSVHDREPVILGGFITDRQTDSTSGVPWLKDVPLIGWAFRSKSEFKQRSELIVLIRPTILNTPQEAAKIAELERASLPNAADAARQFKNEEAVMAERLGVVPGSTNSPPEESSSKSKSSKKKKNSSQSH